MVDYLIKNGWIIDGKGTDAFKGDVAIAEGRIKKIGNLGEVSAKKVIDATGKWITPGFIDMHSHADTSIFLFPDCQSYLMQGITTFYGGTCGDSNAPLNHYWMRKYWEYDMWHEIDPFIYYPETIQPVEKVRQVVFDKTGVWIDWQTFGQYLDKVESTGLGVNMIPVLGHSQLRADVMGKNGNRPPTVEEMRQMEKHIEEAMESGAWGISFGRDYPPSAYGEEDELLALLKKVKERKGSFSIHWRRTGTRNQYARKANKLEGVVEALELALKSGVKMQLSHLDTGFDIFPSNGRLETLAAEETLAVLDDYVEKGVDFAFDVIPGTSGGIVHVPYLAGYLMPWLKQSGSMKNFHENLKCRDYRTKLMDHLRAGHWYNINPKLDPEWDLKIKIISSKESDFVNCSIREISNTMGCDSVEGALRVLLEDTRVMVQKEGKRMEGVKRLLEHPKGTVCTDTFAFDEKGLYGLEGEIPEILPHPHTYCAFPKYINQLAGPRREEAIRKTTGLPASILGFKDRGLIQEGYHADVLVLDFNALKTNENYIETRRYSEGITHVFVNGGLAVSDSQLTGCRKGKVLRK